jgi:hypothetical protein
VVVVVVVVMVVVVVVVVVAAAKVVFEMGRSRNGSSVSSVFLASYLPWAIWRPARQLLSHLSISVKKSLYWL